MYVITKERRKTKTLCPFRKTSYIEIIGNVVFPSIQQANLMQRILKSISLLLFLSTLANAQAANHIVISEVAPMGGASSAYNTGEYIELYNPFSTDVTFGPNVAVVSGNSPAGTNAAEWQVSLAGKTIKGYGFFLIGDGGVTAVTPDVAFPASKNLANSGARSCVQLRDGATVIDAFAWDASTSLAGEGTKFTPTSTTSDKKSFERKSGSSSTADDNLGNAWDSNNNATDFFQNAASAANPQNTSSAIEVNPYGIVPANGVGTAAVAPSLWKNSTPTTLTFTFKPAGDTVRGFKFVRPQPFIWSSGSMTAQPGTVSISQSGDTTILANFVLKGTDSIVVSIPGVTVSDTTDEFAFNVRSAKDSVTFSPLQGQPKTVVYGSPRPMSWVKSKDGAGNSAYLNKWVVVQGVVTVANEFGGPSYLQDATAAIAVFDSSVSLNVSRGDEIVVFGRVSPYYDMFELNPCSLLQVTSEGNPIDTTTLTITQVNTQPQKGVEPYECRLIRVNNITKVLTTTGNPVSTWAVTGSGTNYNLVSGTDTLEVRISPKINLANTSVPSSSFDIVGALGQFTTYYQILPRSADDLIVEGGGPRITSGVPYETNITSTGLTFVWQTDSPGNSKVYYGTTTAYSDSVIDNTQATAHQVAVGALKSATMYHVRLGCANGVGTTYTNDYLVSTSSLSSTGTMNVYFSYPVDTTVAQGEKAQTVSIVTKLLNRINNATYSVDVALYSLSGTVGANVATALVAAKNRGVKVRVIGEADNSSTAPWTTLANNSVPLIFDTYDATNGGAGLMHNKFGVFDNQDSTSDTDDWVWSGSWNATDPGNNDDAQNAIEIQDKALANAYTTEFNEMWGSSTGTPNASTSRFGAHKLDNTPHYFVINSTPVELYFSPSDGTTGKIIKTLNRATDDINFSLLTFTRSDIANVLIAKKKAGLKVRGVMDNRTDQGSVFDTLVASGVDLHLKGSAVRGLYHHKYGLVDAETVHPQQYVITGSHNWSSSAENSNNENTLIIESKRIANLYLQEFAERYAEAGGTDNITVSVVRTSDNVPKTSSLSQNYPNPFNPTTNFELRIARQGFVSVKVFDLLGREVATLVNENKSAGVYTITWNASKLASGVYLYKMQASGVVQTRKMLLVR
jgi:phosphatidylserine/phosphatidylglycerophosphate/cardiolipin synthase-like enzyme